MKNIAKIFTGNRINEKINTEKYLGRTDGLLYIATKDIGFDNQIDYATDIRIPADDNFKKAPANTLLLCIEGGTQCESSVSLISPFVSSTSSVRS